MNEIIALMLANLGLGMTFILLFGVLSVGGLRLIEGYSPLRPVAFVSGAVLLALGALGMLEFPFEQWRASGFW